MAAQPLDLSPGTHVIPIYCDTCERDVEIELTPETRAGAMFVDCVIPGCRGSIWLDAPCVCRRIGCEDCSPF